MNENSRCSILFHFEVPGGRWCTAISMPSSVARPYNSRFHSRTREPLLPPPSAGDHQPLGTWISDMADLVPPTTDRLHREGGRVMVHADADPTGIGGKIVDAIRHCPAQFLDQEIMHPNVLRLALRVPLPAAVPEVADQFLLLRVYRDHRLLLGQRRGNALADVGELRIAIRVAATLPGLAVGLQTELLLLQQFADN